MMEEIGRYVKCSMHLLIIRIKKEFLIVALLRRSFGEVKILVPKFSEKYSVYNSKRILKKMKKYNVQNIVLNDELVKNHKFCTILQENQKYVVTGKRIGKVLLPKILEDVSIYAKYTIEKMKVVLLMNEYSIENLDLIECISKEVKQLSVVSKNHTRFEKTSNRLFERYGYSIKLYDNSMKGFKRDNVIINIDFKEDEVKNAIEAAGLSVLEINHQGEWVNITARKN